MLSDKLRVGHISAYTFGGAAFAARRLHEGLRQTEVESRFWFGDDSQLKVADKTYSRLPLKPERDFGLLKPVVKTIKRRRRSRVRRDYRQHLQNRPEGFEVFTAARQFQDSFLDLDAMQCDLLQLHWLGHIADFPSLFASIPHRMPVVWTLHDMNPFTGGCHYSNGCFAFRSGCGQCPQVANSQADDVSHYSLQVKRRALRGKRMHVVTPSRWLNQLAMESPVWPSTTEFSVIPYGLELEQYRPYTDGGIRRSLGIAPSDFVLAFGAEDVANRRKGMAHLSQALSRLPETNNWHAIVFGGGKLPPDIPNWLKVHSVGYLSQADEKARVYSAADAFVMPSLEDNQPQTGLEALACGTPVIAFDAGGIPEYVLHLENGLLAKTGDVDDLARQILHAANEVDLLPRLGQTARERMTHEFPLSLQASRYVDLYREMAACGETSMRRAA